MEVINMTMMESIIVIVAVIVIGICYTWFFFDMKKEVEKRLAEMEYCPSQEDEESEE